MTRTPITTPPEISVLDAREMMAKARIRHLLVTEPSAELVGMITDREVRLALPSPATTLSVWEMNYLLFELSVGEIMTKTLITVGPRRDAREAARLMVEHKIGALPVVEDGRLVGILTETDLLRAFASSGGADARP